jgi:hypothetical protein
MAWYPEQCTSVGLMGFIASLSFMPTMLLPEPGKPVSRTVDEAYG